MNSNETGPTLQQLILDTKSELDRSYANIANASHGVLTANGLQKLATSKFSAFPAPETLQGIADALGLSINEVVLAAARSLNINVRDSYQDDLILFGAKTLPRESQELLKSMAREMLAWQQGKYEKATRANNGEVVQLHPDYSEHGERLVADTGENDIDHDQLPHD